MGFKLQYKQHVHKNSRIIAEKQGSKKLMFRTYPCTSRRITEVKWGHFRSNT